MMGASMITEQTTDRVAAEVSARYDIVRSEAGPRLSKSQTRREHYTNVTTGLPEYGGLILPSSVSRATRHEVRLPFAHHHTTRLVGRLLGELPQTHVAPRQDNEEEQHRAESVEKMLASIYYHSKAKGQFTSAGWHASTLGAGVFRVGWRVKKNMPYFRSVKPESIFPKFKSGDSGEMEYCIYAAMRSVESVAKEHGRSVEEFSADMTEEGTERKFVRVLDYWEPSRHRVCAGGVTLKDEENRYGFIPYIIVRNMGPQEYAWGLSDQEFYEGLVEYYNVLLSQHADVIKMFSNPPILATRTTMTPADILRIFRDGGVIATSKADADVRILQGSGSPPEFQNQAARVGSLVDTFSFNTGSDSGASGTALMEMGVGLEDLMKLKRTCWEEAQQLLNEYLLRLVEKLGTGKMRFSGVQESGVRSRSFYLELDDAFEMPSREQILEEALSDPSTLGMDEEQIIASRTQQELDYRRLIDSYYTTRIVWNNRSAKSDPQHRLALLNQFAQSALSLRTFLEETGVEDVDREIKRIKQEAEDMPWLRPQMMAAMAQQQQGAQGGQQQDISGMFAGMGGGDATDTATSMLNGSSNDKTRQPGSPAGMAYGGA